jgi:molybdopterin molybdotransferase
MVMIGSEEARDIILHEITPLPVEETPLLQGLGRLLAADVTAVADIPPADNSAMDGYAFKQGTDVAGCFTVAGFLPAGESWPVPVTAGSAIRIMTGAPIPAGCDTVAPFEEVAEHATGVRLTTPTRKGAHIRRRGEELTAGNTALAAGCRLRPQEIGLLAALGRTTVPVFRRPRVAVLATGDELVTPGSDAAEGKIIDCNSSAIAAQVLAAGGEPWLLGIARDDRDATRELIMTGLDADILITTGGVSVGDRDYVHEVIGELGGEIRFRKVNMKPGKPVLFAMVHGTPVFALPGNPAAAMVGFELFIRPSLLKMQGHVNVMRPVVRATLTEPVNNRGERPHFVRVMATSVAEGFSAITTGNQSSARLSSLTGGNALLRLEPGENLPAGATVDLLLLDQPFPGM